MFYMLVLMVASSIICMDASMDTHILLKPKAAKTYETCPLYADLGPRWR